MPSHLRSKNASVEGQQSLLAFDFRSDQSRRRADEVERVGGDDCKVTTSLATDYSLGQGGGSPSRGIMTTFAASREIELLTLEFNAFENVEESTVQVYYKEGSWSGVASDPGQWTKLADTSARIAPDERGAIIPTSDFTPVTIKPSVEYALYLHFDQNNVLRVKRPEIGGIGEVADSNGALSSFMGVPLTDGPFPTTGFDNIAAFEGVFHYMEVEPCRFTVTTSDIFLEFAINSDPEEQVLEELSELVGVVMDALMTSHETLLEYQDEHLLRIGAIETNFEGRSEKCPTNFSKCSIVRSIITFDHLHSITPGKLQVDILGMSDKIVDPIKSQMSGIEVEYVGDSVVVAHLAFLLNGVEAREGFNEYQERYFERVVSDFLSTFPEPQVYAAKVTYVERLVDTRRLNLSKDGLRSRKLEGTLRVITTLYGGGNASKFLGQILENISSNDVQLINELQLQHLRPGEINNLDSGDLFNGISSLQISMDTDTASGDDSVTLPPTSKMEEGVPVFVPIVIVLTLLIVGFVFYRTYGKRKENTDELPKRQRLAHEQLERARQTRETLQNGRRTLNSTASMHSSNSNDRNVHGVQTDYDFDPRRDRARENGLALDRSRSVPNLKGQPQGRSAGLHSSVSSRNLAADPRERPKPTRARSSGDLRRTMLLHDMNRKQGSGPAVSRARSAALKRQTPSRAKSATDLNCMRQSVLRSPSLDRSSRRSPPVRSASSSDLLGQGPSRIGVDMPPRSSRSLSRKRAPQSKVPLRERLSKSVSGIGHVARLHLEDLGLIANKKKYDDASSSESEIESDSDSELAINNSRPHSSASGGDLHRMGQSLKNRNGPIGLLPPPRSSSSGSELHQMRQSFKQRNSVAAAQRDAYSGSGHRRALQSETKLAQTASFRLNRQGQVPSSLRNLPTDQRPNRPSRSRSGSSLDGMFGVAPKNRAGESGRGCSHSNSLPLLKQSSTKPLQRHKQGALPTPPREKENESPNERHSSKKKSSARKPKSVSSVSDVHSKHSRSSQKKNKAKDKQKSSKRNTTKRTKSMPSEKILKRKKPKETKEESDGQSTFPEKAALEEKVPERLSPPRTKSLPMDKKLKKIVVDQEMGLAESSDESSIESYYEDGYVYESEYPSQSRRSKPGTINAPVLID